MNVIPEVRESGAGCLRLFVAFWVLVIGLGMTGSVAKSSEGRLFGYAITAVLIGGVWDAMKKGETRTARKRGQSLRNLYPRTQGTAGEASDDPLERGGWL